MSHSSSGMANTQMVYNALSRYFSELDPAFLRSDPLTLHFIFKHPLTAEQQKSLQSFLANFFSSWQAHGKPLMACGLLSFNQILTVLVDESLTPATGCSKDALFRAVNEWCAAEAVSLAPRSLVPVVQGESINLVDLKDCKKLPSETPVVDVSALRWSFFSAGFNVPACQTSLGSLFGKAL